ncbi:hypothetical protein SAMN05660831_02079 [Thiohalospira halophila DSM 15071]|uniref:Uncharacterized protein n=1 Tax=Thiohalospira halophila DSM 15071 TaxID=1123397 RepID=A0A1I1UA07_9GAMM|nr:hypothetical protein [Thiohalospira halophila]SFD67524.1 hypothetical protein SAMN05660831_02079 [Thiohalospira halophila DSM 15071]
MSYRARGSERLNDDLERFRAAVMRAGLRVEAAFGDGPRKRAAAAAVATFQSSRKRLLVARLLGRRTDFFEGQRTIKAVTFRGVEYMLSWSEGSEE